MSELGFDGGFHTARPCSKFSEWLERKPRWVVRDKTESTTTSPRGCGARCTTVQGVLVSRGGNR